MNKARRKTLSEISKRITLIKNDLQMVFDEETDYMDNMPENLQGSDKYFQSEEICDQLSECIDMFDEIVDTIDEII